MMTSKSLAAAIAATALMPSMAQAATLTQKYESRYERVQKIGLEPGRHIVDDGVGSNGRRPSNERVAKSAQLMLSWLRAARAPEPVEEEIQVPAQAPTTPVASYRPQATTPTVTTPASSGGPEQYAGCESGGDWNAVNPSTGARGRYQIMPLHYGSGGLCEGMGQSPGEQTQCAGRIYETQGSGAWSQCGG